MPNCETEQISSASASASGAKHRGYSKLRATLRKSGVIDLITKMHPAGGGCAVAFKRWRLKATAARRDARPSVGKKLRSSERAPMYAVCGEEKGFPGKGKRPRFGASRNFRKAYRRRRQTSNDQTALMTDSKETNEIVILSRRNELHVYRERASE